MAAFRLLVAAPPGAKEAGTGFVSPGPPRFSDLAERLTASPLLFSHPWGSAFSQDPWPPAMAEPLHPAVLRTLREAFEAQRPQAIPSLSWQTRESRSTITLEDHDEHLVLTVQAELSPAATELDELPADVRSLIGDLPLRRDADLLPAIEVALTAGSELDPVAIERARTAIVELGALWHDEERLLELLRRLSTHPLSLIRAAVVAVGSRLSSRQLLHELAEHEHDLLLKRVLGSVTAEQPLAEPEPGSEEPDDYTGYRQRAELRRVNRQFAAALVDAYAALALARRAGVKLRPFVAAVDELTDELRTPAGKKETSLLSTSADGTLRALVKRATLAEAEEVAEAILDVTAGDKIPLLLVLAAVRLMRGRFDSAAEAVDQAMAAGATFADIATSLGELTHFNRRQVYFDRSQFLRLSGRLEEGLAVIDELLSQEPQAADAWLARSLIVSELERPAEVIAACDEAARHLVPFDRLLEEVDPRGVLAYRRAEAYAARGDLLAAKLSLQAALRDDPDWLDDAANSPLLAPLSGDAELKAAAERYKSGARRRNYLREAAAAYLRDLPAQSPAFSALYALFVHAFGAALLLLDRDEEPVPLELTYEARSLVLSVQANLAALAALDPQLKTSQQVVDARRAVTNALGDLTTAH